MNTTPLFDKAKSSVDSLNAWAAADCPGATYEDLLEIQKDSSPGEAFSAAMSRIKNLVGLLADGRPLKASLDNAAFNGDRLPVYVAALGAARGKRVHDLMET